MNWTKAPYKYIADEQFRPLVGPLVREAGTALDMDSLVSSLTTYPCGITLPRPQEKRTCPGLAQLDELG